MPSRTAMHTFPMLILHHLQLDMIPGLAPVSRHQPSGEVYADLVRRALKFSGEDKTLVRCGDVDGFMQDFHVQRGHVPRLCRR